MTRNALLSLAAAATVLGVSSCGSVAPLGPSEGSQAALRQVAGDWTYSHAGKPTIGESGVPDAAGLMNQSMAGSRIVITEDGSVTFMMFGKSGEAKLTVGADNATRTVLKVRSGFRSEELLYDKKADLISMLGNLEVNKSKGKIPLYFRR